MLSVIASITVKPGHKEEFIEIFKALVPDVLNEKGCIEYAPMIDLATGWPIQDTDDNVVTILEKWESLDALKNHFTEPHMKSYQQKTKEITAGITAKILTEA